MTLAQFTARGINTNNLFRTTSLADAKAHQYAVLTVSRLTVMGCDGRYWVVSARDAGKLRKAVYETI